MTARLLLVGTLTMVGVSPRCQVPISPTWIRVVPSSMHETRLALDQQTNHLHLAYGGTQTHIRAFGTDGTDIPPPFTELVLGTLDPSDEMVDQPLRLLAANDTLYYVEQLVRQSIDYYDFLYRAGSITVDSSSVFNDMAIHPYPYTVLVDILHDPLGELIASLKVLRSFSKAHWMSSLIGIPDTDRITANEYSVYCGRVPNIANVDRASMTLLSPLVVPSSGTSTRTLLMLTYDVINYASMNSNLTMDIGAVYTTGALIWSSVVNLPQTTTLTGIVGDALGNIWVSGSQSASPQTGILYRFSVAGAQTGYYGFGRTIDDIACSGDRIFLSGWDSIGSENVYLAAFDIGITTIIASLDRTRYSVAPNPAADAVTINGVRVDTERITIIDATGRMIKELTGPFNIVIDLSVADLEPGSYFFSISAPNGKRTLPFQVVR